MLALLLAVTCAWNVAVVPEGHPITIEWRVARARHPLPSSPTLVGSQGRVEVNRLGLHKIQCLVKYQHQSETFADGFEGGSLSAWTGDTPSYAVQKMTFLTCEEE